MSLLTWNQSMSVGHPTLDRQHQQLIEIINKLHDAMLAGQSNEILGKVLSELLQYTQSHFRAEEQIMLQNRYTELEQHQREHHAFATKAMDLRNRFQAGSLGISVETTHFLADWLKDHILGTDQKYAAVLFGRLA